MKIMMYINSFNLGGAEKLVYDISECLANRGVSISILSVGAISTPLEVENAKKMKEIGISVLSINKTPGKNRIQAINKTIELLKKQEIDILHTHGQSPDFFGRIAKIFIPKVKVITTIHNTRGYSKNTEKVLKYLTSVYTGVSKETLEYSKDELDIKKNIELIYNGIDISRYSNESEEKKLIILSVGRVTEQKGYHKVVKYVCSYLEKNHNFSWYIIGKYDETDKYYKNLIKEIPDSLKGRVIFTGAISNPEKYYKNATCFLLTSLYEGFGIAYIEALAAGLPIICTKVGIIPEIISRGAEVLLVNKFEEIEELLDRAISDFNDNYINIKVANQFSVENISKNYEDLYKRVMNLL